MSEGKNKDNNHGFLVPIFMYVCMYYCNVCINVSAKLNPKI